MDCITAAGAVYAAVGLGVLKFLPGSDNMVADVVPVDYVVNATLGLVAAIYQKDRFHIAQASSSVEHPTYWGQSKQAVVNYFKENPPSRGISKPSFDMVDSPTLFQVLFFMRYSVPSAIANTVHTHTYTHTHSGCLVVAPT